MPPPNSHFIPPPPPPTQRRCSCRPIDTYTTTSSLQRARDSCAQNAFRNIFNQLTHYVPLIRGKKHERQIVEWRREWRGFPPSPDRWTAFYNHIFPHGNYTLSDREYFGIVAAAETRSDGRDRIDLGILERDIRLLRLDLEEGVAVAEEAFLECWPETRLEDREEGWPRELDWKKGGVGGNAGNGGWGWMLSGGRVEERGRENPFWEAEE